MKTLYGITNVQVYKTADVDDLNEFLLEYDGNIIDIQAKNHETKIIYIVIYKYREG